jgi:spore maturation protein SpmA
MLNYIWLALIGCAVLIGGATGHLKEVTDGAFNMAETAVMKIALPLIGVMALWLGIMRLAEKSGMVQLLARLLRPVMVRLFPDVPPEHPAMGSMLMNMAANMLGLSNAATPLGIRAMEDLETLNPRPGTASNAMCTFLAINTSSIQLIPVTAVGILMVAHSNNPSAIIGTSFMATTVAFVAAVIAVKFLEKLPMFRLPPVTESEAKAKSLEVKREDEKEGEQPVLKPLEVWGVLSLAVFFLFFAAVLALWLGYPKTQSFADALHLPNMVKSLPFESPDDPERVTMQSFSPVSLPLQLMGFPDFFQLPAPDGKIAQIVKSISAISIPLLLSFFPLYAFLRGIKVYEEFVEGAKEGFQVIVRIIPNLVAILVAIGMFRGAGGIDMLTNWLTPVMNAVHFPPELLPMAIIRPLSGSGSLGVFSDIVQKFGPDHLLSRMAGTIYGSTETTFYVLAVYFGSVGIKRTRHAVPAGLVADIVAVIASVIICKQVFT